MTSDVVIKNPSARHDYALFETYEAGIQLTGTEVKSLRGGHCHLRDGFARFQKGELFLFNAHIAPYIQGNIYNHEPLRPRKLLLHKHEVLRIYGKMSQKGFALIPLRIYLKHGIFKCEIALAKGKKAPDRRDDIKKKIVQREIDRAIKRRKDT